MEISQTDPLLLLLNITNIGSLFRYFLFFILLLAGGAYFAGAETALSSVNRIRMISYAENGSRRARRVLYILDHFEEALTTILIGTNIMHIGSASLATLVATRLHWDDFGISMLSLATTLCVFFLSEMIPKTIAKVCNERFALFIAPSLCLLMFLMHPLGLLFSAVTRLAMGLFHINTDYKEPIVSEEDLHDIIKTLGDEGKIDEDRKELIRSALNFTETSVSEIYTPWENVTYIRGSMPLKEILNIIKRTSHSRLPVLNNVGRVIGIIQIRKFLKAWLQNDGKIQLRRLLDRPFFVELGTPIDDQLAGMSASKTHIAIVRNEKKEILGILTVEDILEELVGEIYDEDDKK